MARVFLSFFNAVGCMPGERKMPLFYEGFVKGLAQAGNELMVCSCPPFIPTAPPCPGYLKKKIRDFAPEVVILFNNCFYQFDFEKELGIPVYIYSVDSALLFSNPEFIRENVGRLRFITGEGGDIEKHCGAPKSHILHAPFFTSVEAEEKPITTNISFIGSFFSYGNYLRDFVNSNPGPEERRQFAEYEKLVTANPFITFEELQQVEGIPVFCKANNRLMETITYISSRNRIEVLNRVAELGLDLYGTPSWLKPFDYYPNITLAFRKQQVYSIRHNQDVYNSSKIGINIPHIQALNAFPWRVTDIMASNALLISARMNAFKAMMPEITVPQFESAAEAYDLCRKYIEDEEARRDLSASHREVIEKRFRFRHFLEAFESFSGLKLSGGEAKPEPECGERFICIARKKKRKSMWKLAYYLLRCCLYPRNSRRFTKMLRRVQFELSEL